MTETCSLYLQRKLFNKTKISYNYLVKESTKRLKFNKKKFFLIFLRFSEKFKNTQCFVNFADFTRHKIMFNNKIYSTPHMEP